ADIVLRLDPCLLGDEPACDSGVQVTLLEVDPTIAPGEARLAGGLAERCPAKCHIAGRDGSGLELRAAGWKRDRSPEVVAFGEEFQDLRPGRTEGARSEERRVGKECRSRSSSCHERKK